jgi:hypothetical protein
MNSCIYLPTNLCKERTFSLPCCFAPSIFLPGFPEWVAGFGDPPVSPPNPITPASLGQVPCLNREDEGDPAPHLPCVYSARDPPHMPALPLSVQLPCCQRSPFLFSGDPQTRPQFHCPPNATGERRRSRGHWNQWLWGGCIPPASFPKHVSPPASPG